MTTTPPPVAVAAVALAVDVAAVALAVDVAAALPTMRRLLANCKLKKMHAASDGVTECGEASPEASD